MAIESKLKAQSEKEMEYISGDAVHRDVLEYFGGERCDMIPSIVHLALPQAYCTQVVLLEA